jgi:hypothetical protein
VPRIDEEGLFRALEDIGFCFCARFGWCVKASYKGRDVDFLLPETPNSKEDDYTTMKLKLAELTKKSTIRLTPETDADVDTLRTLERDVLSLSGSGYGFILSSLETIDDKGN